MGHCVVQKTFPFDLRHESFHESSLHSEKLTYFLQIMPELPLYQLWVLPDNCIIFIKKRKIILFALWWRHWVKFNTLIGTCSTSIYWFPSSQQAPSAQFLIINCPHLHWKLRAITKRSGPRCEPWRVFSALKFHLPGKAETYLYFCQVCSTSLLDWLKTSAYPQLPAQSAVCLRVR